jgi:hypothetical protein
MKSCFKKTQGEDGKRGLLGAKSWGRDKKG